MKLRVKDIQAISKAVSSYRYGYKSLSKEVKYRVNKDNGEESFNVMRWGKDAYLDLVDIWPIKDAAGQIIPESEDGSITLDISVYEFRPFRELIDEVYVKVIREGKDVRVIVSEGMI